MKSVRDLACFVEKREAELACGSGTCLHRLFVSEYGAVSEAKENMEELPEVEYEIWADAYARYDELKSAGRQDFTASDCIY